MAKLLDTLMNRIIKGKLTTDAGDEIVGVSHVKTSSNISALSDETLDALKVGDVVQKITGDMKHCYIVTYKEEHKGICLSYFDAGYLETISYDYTDGHWVFNSKDVCEVPTAESLDFSNVDLVVKTVKQTQANFDFTVTPYLNTQAQTDGFTLSTIYNRCEVINGILYFVSVNEVKNETENALTFNHTRSIIHNITINNEEVASKIIDQNGKSLSTNDTGYIVNDIESGCVRKGSSFYSAQLNAQHSGTNTMNITIRSGSSISVEAGASVFVEDRIFMTLI